MTMRQDIGLKIQKARNLRNLSREKLVELVGDENVSVSTIQRLENGETKISLELLLKICEALDVNLSEMLDANSAKSIVANLMSELEEEPRFERYYLDMLKLFYPDLKYEGILDLRKFPIRNLAQFMIYLPLIDKEHLNDVLYRLAGDPFGNEFYLLQQLEFLYSTIPEGNAKAYADHMASKMSYEEFIRYHSLTEQDVQEYIRRDEEIMAISDDYLNILKQQNPQCD